MGSKPTNTAGFADLGASLPGLLLTPGRVLSNYLQRVRRPRSIARLVAAILPTPLRGLQGSAVEADRACLELIVHLPVGSSNLAHSLRPIAWPNATQPTATRLTARIIDAIGLLAFGPIFGAWPTREPFSATAGPFDRTLNP